MESVVLVIHLFLALAIIGLVLLQRSEGGGLGIGGGGMGNFASAKSAANMLSRATAICAFAFFSTSLLLAILAGTHSKEKQGILEALGTNAPNVLEETAEENGNTAEGIKIDEDGAITIPSAPIAE